MPAPEAPPGAGGGEPLTVIVVGSSGVIGTAVSAALEARRHRVVRASRSGDVAVDLTDPASVDGLFDRVARPDAVVCCAANGRVMPFTDQSEDFRAGVEAKLFGQIALARRALQYLTDGGSITLTSGHFDVPFPGGAYGAMVNAGLEAFVVNAAVEMPRNLRLNAVSPGAVRESLDQDDGDPPAGTPAAQVAQVFVRAVEGTMRGRRLDP